MFEVFGGDGNQGNYVSVGHGILTAGQYFAPHWKRNPPGAFELNFGASEWDSGYEWSDLWTFQRHVGVYRKNVSFPLWVPFGMTLGSFVLLRHADCKAAKLAATCACASCGYTRAGLAASAACPECGVLPGGVSAGGGTM